MTQPPFVSVLVAAHGAAEGLAASLDGALEQDYTGRPLAGRAHLRPGRRARRVARGGARLLGAAGDPLADARHFVTLAFAEELLQQRELLAAYGARFDGSADATLAIDASTLLPAAAGQALGALVNDLGLDVDGTAHLIAVLGPIDASVRTGLPERADALLTMRTSVSAAAAAPAFHAGTIDALHALARHATAA